MKHIYLILTVLVAGCGSETKPSETQLEYNRIQRQYDSVFNVLSKTQDSLLILPVDHPLFKGVKNRYDPLYFKFRILSTRLNHLSRQLYIESLKD